MLLAWTLESVETVISRSFWIWLRPTERLFRTSVFVWSRDFPIIWPVYHFQYLFGLLTDSRHDINTMYYTMFGTIIKKILLVWLKSGGIVGLSSSWSIILVHSNGANIFVHFECTLHIKRNKNQLFIFSFSYF